MKCENRLGVYF